MIVSGTAKALLAYVWPTGDDGDDATPSRALMCCRHCCNPATRAGRMHSQQPRRRAGSGSPASHVQRQKLKTAS